MTVRVTLAPWPEAADTSATKRHGFQQLLTEITARVTLAPMSASAAANRWRSSCAATSSGRRLPARQCLL